MIHSFILYNAFVKRPTKDDRARAIAEAALAAFSDKGYRLTQVADVAKLAGVAPGTIYLFAKSKEDLFWLALKLAVGRPLEDATCKELTGEDLRAELIPTDARLSLRHWLDQGSELPSLESVLLDHWNSVSHAARAIKLVERCASDWPELAQAFFGELRVVVIRDLANYLESAANAGLCRKVKDPRLAARLIIETIAWFAMHRLGDPDGRDISVENARDVTIDALLHAFGLPSTTEEIL